MRVLAVDLGATSVRVAAVDLAAAPPVLRIVHRQPHGPVRHADGTLRWDWDGIVRAVRAGLDAALAEGPAASIGVDGWAVDHGLLDDRGRLVAPPFAYRDDRTRGWTTVADRLGRERLYRVTGVQLMPINTVFQLAAQAAGDAGEAARAELARAERLLLLPDLLVRELTGDGERRDRHGGTDDGDIDGYVGAERSNASTTGLLDTGTGEWVAELAAAVGVDPALLPPVRAAGERVGAYRGVPVHLVGSHDTASAVVALPGAPDPGTGGPGPDGSVTAFASTGTWVLVGAERPAPDTGPAAMRANFSNEAGALGGVRFLRNVTGLWLLERLRAAWGDPPVAELVAAAAAVDDPAGVPLVDATDPRFLAPADMDAALRAAAGLGASASRALVVRCALESIAATVARVVDELGTFLPRPVDALAVLGGGARIGLLSELLRRHAGVPVHAGSPEATALGNALVQGIALGRFADLADARTALTPRPTP